MVAVEVRDGTPSSFSKERNPNICYAEEHILLVLKLFKSKLAN